jgi:hypothetical protein
MTSEELANQLESVGLILRKMAPDSDCDYWVYGDRIPDSDLDGYHWASIITNHGDHWVVALPPLPCPGPGPEFKVSTLKDVASLVSFAFQHRVNGQQLSGREELDATYRIYREWAQARDEGS